MVIKKGHPVVRVSVYDTVGCINRIRYGSISGLRGPSRSKCISTLDRGPSPGAAKIIRREYFSWRMITMLKPVQNLY